MTQGADEKTKKVTWPQWIAGIAATILCNQLGLMAGWSSPYVAQLTSANSTIVVTIDEASWVVSLLNFGRLVGAVFGSVFVNYVGSKTTLLITTIPIAIGWICIIMAYDIYWLYAARFLGGTGFGMALTCYPLYMAEIADPEIRGALVTLGTVGMSAGNLMMSVMGKYLKMEHSAMITLSICVVLVSLLAWFPESPHHLIRKNNPERAKRSILWYHRGCDVETELASLTKFVTASGEQSFFEVLKEFRKPSIYKAMIACWALFMYGQMCGINNILYYMESILNEARVVVIDPSYIVMIVMSCGICASFASVFLIDFYGRRFLMSISCIIICFALAGLGTQFQLIHYGVDVMDYQWLPILSVMLFQIASFIGIYSVPSTILGELFPSNVKCVAACFGSISIGLFGFISTATYIPLVNLFTMKYVFWFYGVILLTAVPVTILFVPETKGKSLQQIQDELVKS